MSVYSGKSYCVCKEFEDSKSARPDKISSRAGPFILFDGRLTISVRYPRPTVKGFSSDGEEAKPFSGKWKNTSALPVVER